MSYLVFARKYRPQRFEDIVAQEHVTRTLRNAVKKDRIGSGYLFCGPRGTGKTTTARVLAKALNCVDGPTPDPCGKCSNCLEIAAGTSLDVLEIDAASNTGVDDVRALRENVRYLPTSGKKRIYIIDEVHRLSGAAFDALLKTLEEPPDHVIFMMATTEPLKVPDTILSRTQRFDLKRVSSKDLAAHMRHIADQEGMAIDDVALGLLARKADGSVRDSLSLLDQVAAFAEDSITESLVVDALGLVDRRMLFEFIDAVANRNTGKVLQFCGQVIEGGVAVAEFASELMEHLRYLLLLANDQQAGRLLEFDEEETADYDRQAKAFRSGDIVRLIKIVADLKSDLKARLDERLVLEVTGVKMAELESTIDIRTALDQLAAKPGSDHQKKNVSSPAKVPVKEMTRRAEPAAAKRDWERRELELPQVRAEWPRFLAWLRQRRSMLASQLAMAQVESVAGSQVRVVFGASGKVALQVVQKTANRDLIREAMSEHYRTDIELTFDLDPATDTLPTTNDGPAKQFNAEELLNKSSRIRKLVDRVDGEIIGVKRNKR